MSLADEDENTVYQGIRETLANARKKVFSAVNSTMVEAYWDIGRQIEEEWATVRNTAKGF